MIGVITVGVLQALLLAVALTVVDAIRRSAKPHDAVLGRVERLDRYADVRLHPSATVTPGVLVYRLDDRLFFANVNYVQSRLREAIAGAPTPVNWLVFDAEGLATSTPPASTSSPTWWHPYAKKTSPSCSLG